MDLISRQAAIEKFEPWLKVDGYSEGELNMLKAVLYELRFLSSAQPERKKGKWIGVNPMVDTLMCSECGENIISEEFKSNYCPNCGSYNGGEQE